MSTTLHPVILFDGVCNLCNNAVNFVIRNDRRKKFRFAPFQSLAARELLSKYNVKETEPDTFILIYNNRVYKKSTAALYVFRILGGIYKIFYGFIIVPAFIRNWLYDVVAQNRYKWFGKKSTCMIPEPETLNVFLK